MKNNLMRKLNGLKKYEISLDILQQLMTAPRKITISQHKKLIYV